MSREIVEGLERRSVVETFEPGAIVVVDEASEEGIALMCLAEALLRIPDADTADALIRDKIGRGDWRAHAGLSESLFVNAACWGLVVTGKLVAAPPDAGVLGRALSESLGRIGEPVDIANAVVFLAGDASSWMTGQTIAVDGGALVRSSLS